MCWRLASLSTIDSGLSQHVLYFTGPLSSGLTRCCLIGRHARLSESGTTESEVECENHPRALYSVAIFWRRFKSAHEQQITKIKLIPH